MAMHLPSVAGSVRIDSETQLFHKDASLLPFIRLESLHEENDHLCTGQ